MPFPDFSNCLFVDLQQDGLQIHHFERSDRYVPLLDLDALCGLSRSSQCA